MVGATHVAASNRVAGVLNTLRKCPQAVLLQRSCVSNSVTRSGEHGQGVEVRSSNHHKVDSRREPVARVSHSPLCCFVRLPVDTMAGFRTVLTIGVVAALVVAARALTPEIADPAYDWTPVQDALATGLSQKVFPGYVAAVGGPNGTVFLQAGGHFTYGQADPVGHDSPADTTTDTWFDLASLSKVTGTTTAVAQFYERGELDLNMPLANEYLLGEGCVSFVASGALVVACAWT